MTSHPARRSAIVVAVTVLAAACSSSGSDHSGAPASASNGASTSTSVGARSADTVGAGSSTTATARCTGHRRDRTVAYADHPGTPQRLTSLDLYLPASPRCAPVFVFVHGGGYCCGDKANDIAGPAEWLNRNGWIVASVNYRLTEGAGAVRFPAFVDDVAAAIAFLRAHVGEWGGDGGRIALAGHSTGGEMVALVGTDPAILATAGLDESALRCVLVLDASVLDLPALMQSRGDAATVYLHAFGSDPAGWPAASAVAHARTGPSADRWLVALRPGERPLKLQMQRAFVAALRARGAAVTTVDAASIGHGQVIDDIGSARDRVMTAPVAQFLSACAQ